MKTIRRYWMALVVWNIRRKTSNQLNRLTDKELKDIGLNRGDIDNIVSGKDN